MLAGWIALTGTPGVGKSAAADRLRLRGIPNVDVGAFAKDNDLTDGFDEQRLSAIIDPKRVGKELAMRTQKGQLLLLDGHWSHDVPGVQSAIVLRLEPTELRKRLERRGWPAMKVRENVEAEGMDLVLQESVKRVGARHVYEVDTTGRTLDEVAASLMLLVRGTARQAAAYKPGNVDWSESVLSWQQPTKPIRGRGASPRAKGG